MKLRFFRTGDEAWEEVQKRILKSIEEEERANTPVIIPNTEAAIMVTGKESQTENIPDLVTTTAA